MLSCLWGFHAYAYSHSYVLTSFSSTWVRDERSFKWLMQPKSTPLSSTWVLSPHISILQLPYRSHWTLSSQDSNLHPQPHFALPEIEKWISIIWLRKIRAVLLFGSAYGNNCISFRKRTKNMQQKKALWNCIACFWVIVWDPDAKASEFNSFSVSTVFGSGSKGLFFTFLLILCHTQTAEPRKGNKFMHLALNLEWDLN